MICFVDTLICLFRGVMKVGVRHANNSLSSQFCHILPIVGQLLTTTKLHHFHQTSVMFLLKQDISLLIFCMTRLLRLAM